MWKQKAADSNGFKKFMDSRNEPEPFGYALASMYACQLLERIKQKPLTIKNLEGIRI